MPDQLDREALDELLRLANKFNAARDAHLDSLGSVRCLEKYEAAKTELALRADVIISLIELAREGLDAREAKR